MDSLNISTGEKRIPVIRDGIPAGEITFNPANALWAEKFYRIVSDFQTELTQYQTRYDALEKDNKGLPVQMDVALNLLIESCKYIREKIDYVFGEGTSQIVFGDAMVIEVFPQFFETIMPHVQTARAEKLQPYLQTVRKKRPRKK